MFLLILYQLCFLKPMSLLLLMVFKHPFPPTKIGPRWRCSSHWKTWLPSLGIKSLIHGALTEFSQRVTWATPILGARNGTVTLARFQGPNRGEGEMGWFHLARWWRIILPQARLHCSRVCWWFQSNVFSCSTITVNSIAWHLYLTFGAAIYLIYARGKHSDGFFNESRRFRYPFHREFTMCETFWPYEAMNGPGCFGFLFPKLASVPDHEGCQWLCFRTTT